MSHGRGYAMAGLRSGRPQRIEGEPSDRRVELNLTAGEYDSLHALACTTHTTVAAILREAVNEFVQDSRDREVFTGSKSGLSAR